MRWSSLESLRTLHFEGVPWGELELECMQNKREGWRPPAIFAQPRASHFHIFANEVNNFNRTRLKACFKPRKKMPKNFTTITFMIYLFGEGLFWHCGLFLCFAPSFVNQCKNSISFFIHSSGSHCLDLVKALKWSSKVLSTQTYYRLSLTK